MKSLFIVLEGIDGSGTSTQANLLQTYFVNRGEKAIISPEPSSGMIGNLIRQTLKNRVVFTRDRKHFDQQMAYLFAADRHDHLYNEIDGVFKLLKAGFQVIVPRYYFSSLAYNGITPEEQTFIRYLNSNFPNPDLVIYLDIPVEIALNRLSGRASLEIYENQQKLNLVRKNYSQIFNEYSGLMLQLDGTNAISSIHQHITQFIETQFLS